MIQKVSLVVRVPSVQKTHDFVVPENMSVQKIISLMLLTLMDEYGAVKINNENLVLISMNDNAILNNSCSLKQLGIRSGAKLMLI